MSICLTTETCRIAIVRRKLELGGESSHRNPKYGVGDAEIGGIRFAANAPERVEKIQLYLDEAERQAQLIKERR